MLSAHKQIQTFDFNFNQTFNSSQTANCKTQEMDFENAIGNVCAEYVWIYPPGIPLLLPGEKITKQVFNYITYCKNNNLQINSTFKNMPSKINVIKLDKK